VTLVTERAGVFDDALQETMLTTYRVGRKSRRGKVNFLTLDGGARAAITKAGVFSLPPIRTRHGCCRARRNMPAWRHAFGP
jgi:adenine-specific DNA-methyltransferase